VTEVQGEEPGGNAGGKPIANVALADSEELLFRQVHPHFFDAGEPTNGAFRPGSNDNGELSVGRSSLTTAQEAFIRHTEKRGLASTGVWAVSVGEVTAVELKAIPDPEPDDEAHSFVDFRSLSRKQCEGKSKLLRRDAVARGCQYKP
jgi:hypothetical protein